MGAWELRNGVPKVPAVSTVAPDVVRALTLDMWFDFLAVRLNGERAQGKRIVLNWRFSDTQQALWLNLENSALTHLMGAQAAQPDATLTLTRATLDEISLQRLSFPAALQSGRIVVTGKAEKLAELLSLIDVNAPMFPLVEPRPAP